jgi:hypothetical protein
MASGAEAGLQPECVVTLDPIDSPATVAMWQARSSERSNDAIALFWELAHQTRQPQSDAFTQREEDCASIEFEDDAVTNVARDEQQSTKTNFLAIWPGGGVAPPDYGYEIV